MEMSMLELPGQAGNQRAARALAVEGEHDHRVARLHAQRLGRLPQLRAQLFRALGGFDEAAGDGRLRPGKHVVQRAALDDFAVLHHGHVGADLLDHGHLVRDDDDGDAQAAGSGRCSSSQDAPAWS